MNTILNTNIITGIIAIAAIISPIIVAHINNKFELKKKTIEYEEKTKQEEAYYKKNIYEDYLRYASMTIHTRQREGYGEYSKFYPLVLLYFSDELCDSAMEVNEFITSCKFEEADGELRRMAYAIRQDWSDKE